MVDSRPAKALEIGDVPALFDPKNIQGFADELHRFNQAVKSNLDLLKGNAGLYEQAVTFRDLENIVSGDFENISPSSDGYNRIQHISGDAVRLGRIASHDDDTYFDLNNDKIVLNGKFNYDVTTAGVFLGKDLDDNVYKLNVGNATNYFKFSGTVISWAAANTSLDESGNLTATSATISGAITATSGTIGGFTVNATDGLYSGSGATRVQMKPGAGFWCGATAQASAPFSANQAGAVTMTNCSITSGGLYVNGGNIYLQYSGSTVGSFKANSSTTIDFVPNGAGKAFQITSWAFCNITGITNSISLNAPTIYLNGLVSCNGNLTAVTTITAGAFSTSGAVSCNNLTATGTIQANKFDDTGTQTNTLYALSVAQGLSCNGFSCGAISSNLIPSGSRTVGTSGTKWTYGYFTNTAHCSYRFLDDHIDALQILRDIRPETGIEADINSYGHPHLNYAEMPEFMTNRKLLWEEVRSEMGEMITKEDFDEFVKDKDQLGYRLNAWSVEHSSVLETAIRQIDAIVADLATRVSILEAA